MKNREKNKANGKLHSCGAAAIQPSGRHKADDVMGNTVVMIAVFVQNWLDKAADGFKRYIGKV